jgi:Mg2+-importing ATPase
MKRRPEASGSPAPASLYWSRPAADLMTELGCTPYGLSTEEARERLQRFGPNALAPRRKASALATFLRQFINPLVLILLFAAAVSMITAEWADAAIVITIVVASAALTFFQEYAASNAVEALRARVTVKATVLRNGKPEPVPAEEVVPGDLMLLSAGSLIPADGLVLEARDFFINQAVLTGETFPVEKKPGPVAARAGLAERVNCVFMGTSARSGTARALVVDTGGATAFGQIAQRLTLRPPETEFERGIRRFGNLLSQIMTLLVLVVFAINVILHRPVIDSLLFSIALAVGMAPELLPAIISVSLSKGAKAMARRGVIVRRLNAIENLGGMDILCTDKTGTLTEGIVRLDGAVDVNGRPSDDVLRCAYLNAAFQTGLSNPLDEAILAQPHPDTTGMDKLEEIPYDFVRKRLSVVIDADPGTPVRPLLIVKGALSNVLAVCTRVRDGGKDMPLDAARRSDIDRRYTEWSGRGIRVLGLAIKDVPRQAAYSVEADEVDMAFLGFLLFFDPPKGDVRDTLAALAHLGVEVKIITGDNRLVARQVADAVGLPVSGVLTASEMDELRDEALWNVAERTTLFVEVDPNQKERIILALRRMGHVVGYMGDGINDAPALHDADIGISVNQAVDVAKEAADFVLLERDLGVLCAGIEEGRRTFANTIKYVFTTTSANFGNMFSMAGASLFLPFLPLLAKQILLNNFLSDFPALGIAGDLVDKEMVERPHCWNIRFIRDFMIIFGLVSSAFDYLTFGVLLFVVRAAPQQFRTGWFVESLLTELVIALVVRTRRPFYRSRPGKVLWTVTLAVALVTLAIPYLPFGGVLGFTPLPAWLMLVLLGITGLYVLATEAAKRFFYARGNSWERGSRR